MKRNWLLVLGILLMASLIAYRSCVIPITHDEASTWLNYRHINVWSCIANAACWGTGNNHWLNTLLLQWSASFFGDGVWALRLPNVLAGIGYLVCAALISTRYSKNQVLQCAGFLLLCGHVYLLDFFSLARGYGLMASGAIWGIYALLRYIEKYELRWLAISLSAFSFAILGNFTALLPWSAMASGWFLWLIINKKFNLLFQHSVLWLVNAGILFLLLQFPIKTLAGSGEFDWGAANPWAMAKDLMVNLLYGVRYFGDHTSLYLLFGLIVFVLVICCMGLLIKKHESNPPVIFMALLLLLNIIVIILQQKITGSLAPTGRKSIYFIPFIFSFLVLGLALIRNMKTGMVVGSLLSLTVFLHFVRTLPVKSCREWYYDAYYPEMISTIFPEESRSDSIRLGTSWIFNPALRYYQKTNPLPISGLDYQNPLVINSTMQYYFVEQQDTAGMAASRFVLEKRIGPFLLFKNVYPHE